jgi:TRAP-type C4-dicarboxylate transport system permease small subunit
MADLDFKTLEKEVVQMQSRIVSIASLMVVVASVFLFLAGAWEIMSQRLDEGSGVMALAGSVVAAIVFSYRCADPKWLDPISIVKSR